MPRRTNTKEVPQGIEIGRKKHERKGVGFGGLELK